MRLFPYGARSAMMVPIADRTHLEQSLRALTKDGSRRNKLRSRGVSYLMEYRAHG